MKKNSTTIVLLLTSLMLVASLFQINSLKREVSDLRSDLDRNYQMLYNNIQNIHQGVEARLEEESNQLSISNWEYGEIDVDNRTVEIICTVVPKVYTPSVTRASIVANDSEHELTLTGDAYTAIIDIPLFETSHFTQLQLRDNDTIRTQNLDWQFTPRHEALINSYANLRGNASGRLVGDEFVWSNQQSINITIERNGEFQIQSVELVKILDGKEIGRTPIDISDAGQREYAEQIQEYSKEMPEFISHIESDRQTSYVGSAHFLYPLTEEFHIPKGSMLEVYVDIVDGYGLRYRTLVECYAITKDGNPDEARIDQMMQDIRSEAGVIFDKNGQVVVFNYL